MRLIRTLVIILHAICFHANLLAALPADAQLVQVPNLSEFGNGNNTFPFFAIPPMRYQQIYASSAFPLGGTIDKIMFRDDEVFAEINGPYFQTMDLQISFAYAANSPANASRTFASNIGDDFTIVLDGVATESHDGSPPTTFGFVIDVADTFMYDPSRGDLLMQVLVRDNLTNTVSLDGSSGPQQNVTTRIWASGINTTTGLVGSDKAYFFGLVTQFEFIPIPEPSAIVQFGAMLLLLIAHRRRHE